MKRSQNSAEELPVKGTPEASGEHPVAMVADRIAHTRTLTLPGKGTIPAVPGSYRSPTAEDRRRNLRPLDAELVAETILALDDLAEKGAAALVTDLGDAGKEAADAAKVSKDLGDADEQVAQAEALLEYVRTRRAIIASDAVRVLDAVDAEVTHRAKRAPALAQRYRKVLNVTAARNAKIAAGIESAKAARKPA